MEDKIIGSHFVNIYQDDNGNIVHYQQIYMTLESAQLNARDRKGWKFLYTIEIEHTVRPL